MIAVRQRAQQKYRKDCEQRFWRAKINSEGFLRRVVFSWRRVFRRGREVGCNEVGGGEVSCSEVGGGEVGCDEVGDGGESVLRDERV
ncbi:hypothetical protein Tco_1155833 [Tanacetum coccineum]